ncbi:MAG: hypothetical protein NVSMB46_01780 [Candidatus Saccharimonadales bacterium]
MVTGTSGVTTADSSWIGIGGVTTSDLIQIGTEDTVSPSGAVSRSGFYELLPASAQTIPNFTVQAGDVITASLTQTSTGHWTLTIKNATSGGLFTLNTTYASTLSSSEWIEEDPSYTNNTLVPFDHFGTVNFSGGTTTENGIGQTIASSLAQQITMVNSSGQPIATPSALGADNKSFSVTRNN